MFDPDSSPPPPKRHEPAVKAPPVTLALVLILTAITALLNLLSPDNAEVILRLFAFTPSEFFAVIEGQSGEPISLIGLFSHAFLHLDWLHLATNAGFLLAFGSLVEKRCGPFSFLFCFFVSAGAGALAQAFLSDAEYLAIPLIGASGGLSGVMALAVLTAFRSAPQQANFILVMVALNVGIGVMSELGLTGGYLIGWQAHLGGFAAGLIYGLLFKRGERRDS